MDNQESATQLAPVVGVIDVDRLPIRGLYVAPMRREKFPIHYPAALTADEYHTRQRLSMIRYVAYVFHTYHAKNRAEGWEQIRGLAEIETQNVCQRGLTDVERALLIDVGKCIWAAREAVERWPFEDDAV
jgi:hypothetical protein